MGRLLTFFGGLFLGMAAITLALAPHLNERASPVGLFMLFLGISLAVFGFGESEDY